ncbi:hypothetical protein Cal7507_1647 [Calothrix sp. PCC 7507]|nr:hypothetical protein Cal7507_1647 [Calothrix sp. PCC 7507]
MKFNNLHPDYDLAPQKVSDYISDVAISVATLRAISTNNDNFITTKLQGAITRQKVHHSPQPTALPNLVQLNHKAVFSTVAIWVWTRKIAEVVHFHRNQITTLIGRIHWAVSTQVATAPSRLAKPPLWRKSTAKLSLQRALAIVQFPATITATTNLQDNTKNKLKNPRNLRSWEISVCCYCG